VLPLYRTVAEPLDDAARVAALGATSPPSQSASSVRFFAQAAGTLDGPKLVLRSARRRARSCARHGAEPDLEALRFAHAGPWLVETLVRFARA